MVIRKEWQLQIGRSPATTVAESSNIVEQNQSISDCHSPPPRNSCLLLPLSDLNSGLRRIPLVAHLRHMRNLVRLLLDSGSVPQMGSHQPGDLPGPAVHEIRAGGGAQQPGSDRLLRQLGGPSQGAAHHNREHGAVHPGGGLSGGQGELLRVG